MPLLPISVAERAPGTATAPVLATWSSSAGFGAGIGSARPTSSASHPCHPARPPTRVQGHSAAEAGTWLPIGGGRGPRVAGRTAGPADFDRNRWFKGLEKRGAQEMTTNDSVYGPALRTTGLQVDVHHTVDGGYTEAYTNNNGERHDDCCLPRATTTRATTTIGQRA